MSEASNTFSTSRPRKGDQVTYCGHPYGTVSSVEGNLCYTEHGPFIWAFHDGLNCLAEWPTKKAEHRLCSADWPDGELARLKASALAMLIDGVPS